MIASVLRLLALRPLLGMAILGVPVLVLLAVGLITVFAVKAIVALAVPLLVVVTVFWLVRRLTRPRH